MNRKQATVFLVGFLAAAAVLGLVMVRVDPRGLPQVWAWVVPGIIGTALAVPFFMGFLKRGRSPSPAAFVAGGAALGAILAATFAYGLPARPRPAAAPSLADRPVPPGATAPPGMQAAGPHGGPQGNASIDELRARIERDPRDVDALVSLARLNMRIGRSGAALSLLRRALVSFPDDAAARAELSRALLFEGLLEQAGAEAETALAADPASPAAASVTLLTYAAGDRRSPAEILEDVGGVQATTHTGLMEHLELMRDALVAADADPGDPAAARAVGDELFHEGLHALAAEYYARGVAASPDDADLHAGQARAHAYAGQLDQARAPALRALELRPDAEIAQIALAATLESGDVAAAERAVRALEATGSPDAAGAREAYELVADLLRQAEQSPDDAAVRYRVADELAVRGLQALAWKHAFAAVQADPDTQDHWLLMARLLQRLGQPAEAVQAMDRAHALAPLDHDAMVWTLDVALGEARDAAMARAWLDRLREAHPGESRLPFFEEALARLGGGASS
jgi:tetratricopeptide (TPR) repeat protein